MALPTSALAHEGALGHMTLGIPRRHDKPYELVSNMAMKRRAAHRDSVAKLTGMASVPPFRAVGPEIDTLPTKAGSYRRWFHHNNETHIDSLAA